MPKTHVNHPTRNVKVTREEVDEDSHRHPSSQSASTGATRKNYAPHLSRKELRAIFDAHGIPASDRLAIAALVYHGKPVSQELHAKLDGRWRRSRRNGEYAKCVEAILQALSAPFYAEHKFPPKSYRVPKGYDFYTNEPKSAA